MSDREQEGKQNLGLVVKRLQHLVNRYQVSLLLSKNLDKTIMDNKCVIIHVHLHKQHHSYM